MNAISLRVRFPPLLLTIQYCIGHLLKIKEMLRVKSIAPSNRLRNSIKSNTIENHLVLVEDNETFIEGEMSLPLDVDVVNSYIRVRPTNLKSRKGADFEFIKRINFTSRKFYDLDSKGKLCKRKRSEKEREAGYKFRFGSDQDLKGRLTGITHRSVMNLVGTFFEQFIGQDKSGIEDNQTSSERIELNKEYSRWLSSGIQGFEIEVGLAQLEDGRR